jgi:hypothetical protein
MKHEESKLQQQCVAWFRAQYPQYAMLLVHPINEGSGHSRTDRFRQVIHKAEGAVAGVPDLILFLPATFQEHNKTFQVVFIKSFNGIGFEFKTPKKTQSQEQKNFEKMFKAAGYEYEIIRYFDEFKMLVETWINSTDSNLQERVQETHREIVKAAEDREREKFYKVIGKK